MINREVDISAIWEWAKDLFPICRSITGPGLRETLKYIQNLLSATAGLTAEFFKEPMSATIASGTNDNLQDPVEQLRKLKSLLDEGVISEEEFTSKKKTLLNKI